MLADIVTIGAMILMTLFGVFTAYVIVTSENEEARRKKERKLKREQKPLIILETRR